MGLTVYGIPTCTTVRRARAWLDAAGQPHEFVDLRQRPPGEALVSRWVAAFGAKKMRNTSGASFRALGPERDSWTESEWVSAFAGDPMLIKRPVIERDGVPLQVGFTDALVS